MSHSTSIKPITLSLIFISISFMILMMNIDFSGIALAFPSMALDLKVGLQSLQWIIVAYGVAAASVILVAGRLGDSYGHKKLFLIGIAIFALASLPIGFANNINIIYIFRICQGVGAAIAWPLGIVLIKESFPPDKQGLALGLAAMIMGLSLSIGPLAVALFLHYLDWRYIFFINVPLGIIAGGIGVCVIPQTNKPIGRPPNVLLCLLFIVSIVTFMLSFMFGQKYGVSNYLFYDLMLASFITFTLFVICQKLTDNTLLDNIILTNIRFLIFIFIRIGWQIAWFMPFFIICLMLQNIFHYSVMQSSLILLSFTLVFGLISPFSGRLFDRFGAKPLILIGLCIMLICGIWFNFTNIHSSMIFFIGGLILLGIALGMSFPNLLVACMRSVPTHYLGMAGGALYTALFIGTALATATGTWMIKYISHINLTKQTILIQRLVPKAKLDVFKQIMHGSMSSAKLHMYFQGHTLGILTQFVKANFIESFVWMIRFGMLLTIIMIVVVLFLPKPERPATT